MDSPIYPTSRGQTERVIGVARVALAVSGLFAVWMDPLEPVPFEKLTYGLHALYLTYSLALMVLIWRGFTGPRLPIVTHVIDIILASIFQYLTLGPSSPFFLYFIFSVFCGAMRWGWRGTLRTATVVVVAYLAMGAGMSRTLGRQAFELDRFIIRTVYLAVTAGLLVYLGRYEERLRNEIRRLARWPSAAGADIDRTVRDSLAYASRIVDAGQAALVWERADEPTLYVAVWSAATASSSSLSKHSPDAFTPLVPARLEQSAFVAEESGDTMTWLVSDSTGIRSEKGPKELHPAFQRIFSGRGLSSAPFRTDRVSGRVFFTDVGSPADEILPLIEVVARELGASLDQLHVTKRLQEIAAREERIRVARDLHDGVLQSLTGIRLEMRAVAALDGIDSPMRDRLFAMERAIAIEQRELRLFIEELEPRSVSAAPDTRLATRLDTLRERLALEWKAPVNIRVTQGSPVLPARIEQAVPLMVHEAVVNALKHGQPSRVSVTVDGDPDELRIVIADDGRGFPVHGHFDHATLANGMSGPKSLLSRVAELGGRMSVDSSAGGARVEIVLGLSS